MIAIAIFTGLLIVLLTGAEWALPFIFRPDNLFSVTVAPDTRSRPEGRALIRSWRASTGIAGILVLIVTIALAIISSSQASLIVVSLLPAFIAILQITLYAVFHGRARAFAVPAAAAQSERSASLRHVRYTEVLPLWWEILPLLVIIGTAITLAVLYPSLPQRYPIHWDLNGVANGFATKSIGSAFSLVWTQLGLWVFLTALTTTLFMARMTPTGGSEILRSALARYMYFLKVGLLLIFGFIATLTAVDASTGSTPSYLIVSVPLAFAIFLVGLIFVIFVRYGQSGWRVAPTTALGGDSTPDSAWKLGVFYFNRQDKALFVERRSGMGFTLNFAHPGTLIFMGLLVAFILGSLILGIRH